MCIFSASRSKLYQCQSPELLDFRRVIKIITIPEQRFDNLISQFKFVLSNNPGIGDPDVIEIGIDLADSLNLPTAFKIGLTRSQKISVVTAVVTLRSLS